MATEEAQNGGGAVKVDAAAATTAKAEVVFTTGKPQLFVEAPNGNNVVQFYKDALGAEEVTRVNHLKRKAEQEIPLVLSVELQLGSSLFIVADLTYEDSSDPKLGLTTTVEGLFWEFHLKE